MKNHAGEIQAVIRTPWPFVKKLIFGSKSEAVVEGVDRPDTFSLSGDEIWSVLKEQYPPLRTIDDGSIILYDDAEYLIPYRSGELPQVDENELHEYKEALFEMAEKLRFRVEEILRGKNFRVIRRKHGQDLLFQPPPPRFSKFRRIWPHMPLIGRDGKLMKIKKGIYELMPDHIPTFDHPNVVREVILKTGQNEPTKEMVVTISDDHPGAETLRFFRDRMDDGKKMKILADGARGLAYVHSQGYMHSDMNSHNILVTGEEGSEVGKIFDFEHAKKIRIKDDKEPVYGPAGRQQFREEFYYLGDGGNFYALDLYDDKKDVFGFGMAMMDVFAGISNPPKKALAFVGVEDPSKKEATLMSCVDIFVKASSTIKTLIKNMLQADRDKRPSMDEVARILEQESIKSTGAMAMA